MGMKKLSRYVLFNFLRVFFYTTVFGLFLFYLSDFFSNISSILRSHVGVVDVIEYYLFYTPFVLYWSLPLIFAISILISLGLMALRNELTVIRASGVSIIKMAKPIFFISVAVAIFLFFSGEFLVNRFLNKAMFIRNVEMNLGSSHVWVRRGNYFMRLTINGSKVRDVKLYEVQNNALVRVIYASSGTIYKGGLILYNGEVVNLKDRIYLSRFKRKKLNVSIKLSDVFRGAGILGMPSLSELFNGLKRFKSQGYYYRACIAFRFLYPISCVVLSLFVLTFVLRITSRRSGFIKGVFNGSVMSIIYISAMVVLNSMGKVGIIPPVTPLVVLIVFFVLYSMYRILMAGL